MKNPIQLNLKRPAHKSYPHIHGLYLLLRASGLSYVDSLGKKPVLLINEDTYKQWTHINPTEQYGNLLEVWFIHAYADIIGEFSRPEWSLPDNFDAVAHFLASYDVDAGLQVAGNRDAETRLNYFMVFLHWLKANNNKLPLCLTSTSMSSGPIQPELDQLPTCKIGQLALRKHRSIVLK